MKLLKVNVLGIEISEPVLNIIAGVVLLWILFKLYKTIKKNKYEGIYTYKMSQNLSTEFNFWKIYNIIDKKLQVNKNKNIDSMFVNVPVGNNIKELLKFSDKNKNISDNLIGILKFKSRSIKVYVNPYASVNDNRIIFNEEEQIKIEGALWQV
jgi:hypothetical protein